ncbi:MAG: NADH-quinone oxidoreductase subunit A [Acidilobaceae archaeon]
MEGWLEGLALRDLSALILAPLTLTSLLGIALFTLYLLLGGSRAPASLRERYESGNLPTGSAREPIKMQYIAYLVLFATLEPILILFGFVALAGLVKEFAFLMFFLLALSVMVSVYGAIEAKRTSRGEIIK